MLSKPITCSKLIRRSKKKAHGWGRYRRSAFGGRWHLAFALDTTSPRFAGRGRVALPRDRRGTSESVLSLILPRLSLIPNPSFSTRTRARIPPFESGSSETCHDGRAAHPGVQPYRRCKTRSSHPTPIRRHVSPGPVARERNPTAPTAPAER
jgi:hypothetical protein